MIRSRSKSAYLRGALVLSLSLAAGMVATAIPSYAFGATGPRVEGDRTQPTYSYTAAIREFVMVETPLDSDGDGRKDLARADIIRPRESDQGLKVPVIIVESPYYDNAGRGNERERKRYDANGNLIKFPLFYDNYFVPRGYAVLHLDMLGTTKSDGCPVTGGLADIMGGKATVDWLNGRAKAYRADGTEARATWTTGKAGMIGKSYDGTLANAVAATGVHGLETIVPISAISSWYQYSRMNGLIYFSAYASFLADFVDTDPQAKCAAVRAGLDAAADDVNGNYNTYWRERDYIHGLVTDVSNVRASVFVVHTVNDLNVKTDHFAPWWKALRERGIPRKLWLGQYGHVDPFDFRREEWINQLHLWFDRWLYGMANGIMNGPRVDVQTGPDEWITQPEWPAPSLHVSLRPRPDGSLGLRQAAGGSTAQFTDAPLSESAMVSDPTTPHPNRVAFVTQPLASSARLSGKPMADLHLKLDRPTANLTALLVDYGEDVRVDYLGPKEGIRDLTVESCHGESTVDDDACYRQTETTTANMPVNVVARGWLDAQNSRSLSNPTPLPVGRFANVRWDTLAQDYVVKPGHRLALILAGTDSDFIVDEPATGASVTVDLGRSRIVVPLRPQRGGELAESDFAATSAAWTGPTQVTLPIPPRDLY